MATVNFSIPDEVKQAFNDAFRGENKSAIVTALMRRAVEDRALEQRRRAAVDGILALRAESKRVATRDVTRARKALRR